MNGPLDENAAPRKALADLPPEQNDVDAEVSRGSDLDRHAETRLRWVEANRGRIRELNRRWRVEHLERARQLNRDSMRRAAARKRREADLRAQGRERAKRWREAHPDRVREYQQRWVEENGEKVREYYNRYYANHRDKVNSRAADRRDADPERTRQASRQWVERNKGRRAELQRHRRSDPETYQSELTANAAARRLKRRLAQAGLPTKQLHSITAAERRANEREAGAYFDDPALPEHLRQFTVFAESLTQHMLMNGDRMREFAKAYVATRERMGLRRVQVEDIMYARAVELVTDRMRRVDMLTSHDIAAAVRSTKAAVQQEEHKRQFERLVRSVVTHAQRNVDRLSEEAAMENVARSRLKKHTLSVESLVVRLAMQEVLERVPASQLTAADARKAARFAKLRIALLVDGRSGTDDNRSLRRDHNTDTAQIDRVQ